MTENELCTPSCDTLVDTAVILSLISRSPVAVTTKFITPEKINNISSRLLNTLTYPHNLSFIQDGVLTECVLTCHIVMIEMIGVWLISHIYVLTYILGNILKEGWNNTQQLHHLWCQQALVVIVPATKSYLVITPTLLVVSIYILYYSILHYYSWASVFCGFCKSQFWR